MEIFIWKGLILFILEKQNQNNKNIYFSCDLILEYNYINNKKYIQKYNYKTEKDEYKKDFFSCKTIEHGMGLYY